MRLLKTKNFLIGFIVMMISIIPISNVKAYDEDIINRVSAWANSELSSKAGIPIENSVVLYNHNDDTYYTPIKQTIYSNEMLQTQGWFTSYYSNHFILVSPDWYRIYLYKYNPSSDSFTKVSGSNWYTGNSSSVILDSSDYDFEIVHADKDITFGYWVPSGTYKGITYYSGDIFFRSKGIEIIVGDACDEDGADIKAITIDFANVYSEGRTYQYKTSIGDWIDITSQISEAAQSGYYVYKFFQYHNTTIQARILENGVEINSNSIAINDLQNFGPIISTGNACDELGRDIHVVKFDLRYCWQENYIYQYSYDNQNFYTMNVSNENKLFTLNHGIQTFIYFRILDTNGDVIYTYDYDVIFDGLVKHVHVKEDTNINENREKELIINVDFSDYFQFSDMYNLKFYINNEQVESETVQYILTQDTFINFKEIQIDVYVDNFLVDSSCYVPDYGGVGFSDKYDQVLQDKVEEELNNSDYESILGMVKAIENFLNVIKDIVIVIFRLIERFFFNLNVWIRATIINIFIVRVITKVIKEAKK